MEFKKFSAGKYSYGKSNPKCDPLLLKTQGITNVNFEDPLFDEHNNDPSNENYSYLQKFIETLAVCHTVIVEEKH